MDEKQFLLRRVNEYGVLSVSPGMWVLLLLASYPVWLGFSLRLAGEGLPDGDLFFFGHAWLGWLASLPAVLVWAAALRRDREERKLVRWVWRWAAFILTIGLLVHLSGAGFGLFKASEWRPWPERAMLVVAIFDLLALAYLWRSPCCAQLFAEFPEAKSK